MKRGSVKWRWLEVEEGVRRGGREEEDEDMIEG